MNQPEVYISHAWGGESDEVMNKIVKRLEKDNIQVVYDHKDLKYRGSISEFMNELGKAKAVILIVSNKYLRSEYCMFELLQIYANNQFLHRIFPVVLDEVQISKSTDRLDLVKYWETQQDELENKIRELNTLANIEGITEDLNLYTDIRKHIAKFTYILRDINTLDTQQHYDENFESLVSQMQNALTERETPKMSPLEWSEKVSKKMPWKAFGALAFLLSFSMLIYFVFFLPSKQNSNGSTVNPFNLWSGKWKQEVQSTEKDPITGTIELTFSDNILKGKVKNVYPDRISASTTNTLYDMSINKSGDILKGKWSSDDFPNYGGTFEWHLDGEKFTGYYTLNDEPAHYTWKGEK